MTANPEQIVQHLQHEFPNLLAYVTGPEARLQTASTVELTVFRRPPAVGRRPLGQGNRGSLAGGVSIGKGTTGALLIAPGAASELRAYPNRLAKWL